ncbi:MAG: ROK family protein, partial [Anaerolineaceae bacterium]|nr:ROK family protein [Anaerolineaceae bacterium]
MAQPKTANQTLVREMNASIVMDSIRLYAPLSRADLAARTGLMRSTISLIVDELIGHSFVREIDRQDSKIGRPGTLLEVNPNAGFAVGLEIGVDFLAAIVTNFVGEILWRQTQPTPEDQHQIAKLEQVEQVIAGALEAGKKLGLRPLGIGVGVPGLVD